MTHITIEDLSACLYPDEQTYLRQAVKEFSWPQAQQKQAQDLAVTLIEQARSASDKHGALEMMLQRYPITGDEGRALMQIAEALLRIPDKKTAYSLIEEKLKSARWNMSTKGLKGFLKASGIGLSTARILMKTSLSSLAKPAIYQATRTMILQLGSQFILGETISEARANSALYQVQQYGLSYDMLGEAARTQEDADMYFQAYKNALKNLAQESQQTQTGISVKLSALHPRYEVAQKDRCIPDMCSKLLELCEIAAQHNLTLTLDAEEAERLCLSLEIFENLLRHSQHKDWNGLGLAVQAYQLRALDALRFVQQKAQHYNRKIHVRLVKGAYWDREIKHAQELGLTRYPVFTRKVHTDLHYLICAQYILRHSDVMKPLFATHNAHTIAAVKIMADTLDADFELQRLHGMGDSIYSVLAQQSPMPASVYAPVGAYENLLPYLVRRMLENGANSSFVNQVLDPKIAATSLAQDPLETSKAHDFKWHPKISLPLNLFKQEKPYERDNSAGKDYDDPETLSKIYNYLQQNLAQQKLPNIKSLICGIEPKNLREVSAISPIDCALSNGKTTFADETLVIQACESGANAFPNWNAISVDQRADIVLRYSDLLEHHSLHLKSLLVREAGKTIRDAHTELREAVDFCRYYANQARAFMPQDGELLPAPTGELNLYKREGRGVFACIAPWNFPLAIFTGQIVAALVSGNCVIAKPAPQTNRIAYYAVQLLHQAGAPREVLQLVLGEGDIGAALVNNPHIAGVAFTGSTQTARTINQALAMKENAPIVPLIAETGGQNAMIIDSSALLEQALDHVINSAFGSAGQRCSALRVLYLHDAIADEFIRLLKGAMEALRVGDPRHYSCDVGPIIDEAARAHLLRHVDHLKGFGKLIAQAPLDPDLEKQGCYFAPRAYELHNLQGLDREVFGPIVHILRYNDQTLDDQIDELNALGYGLTLGVQTRRDDFAAHIAQKVRAGNVYVNRSMIGAVVGSQPFGGKGLSGTGPKAGGPDYLKRFMGEHVISADITAAGGNVALVSLDE